MHAEGTGIDTLLLHFLFRRLVRAVRTPQNAFFYVLTPWRNGNASDSRPEDWGFDSLWGHFFVHHCLRASKRGVRVRTTFLPDIPPVHEKTSNFPEMTFVPTKSVLTDFERFTASLSVKTRCSSSDRTRPLFCLTYFLCMKKRKIFQK